MPKTRKVRTFSSDKDLIHTRRRLIAEKAVRVFLEKGYDKATMRDLGKACGVTSGALYHYIGSKEDILHLIFFDVHSGADAQRHFLSTLGNVSYAKALGEVHLGADAQRHFLSTLGNVSYARALSECMSRYFKGCDLFRESYILFNREIQKFSREDRHSLLASEADVVSFYEQLLREGTEAGEFQVSDPSLIAHNILMYGQDWALRKWYLKQHYSLKEYTQKQIRMVLELVTTKTNQTAKAG